MERIDTNTPYGDTLGHLFRYHLASGFVNYKDKVLDAACGSGYGGELLTKIPSVEYHGVDKELSYVDRIKHGVYIKADLTTWTPDFSYDVFVGFETIEHLPDYSNYIKIAQQARKWIIVSAPTIPTKHMNPYHLQDFVPDQLVSLFANDHWMHFQSVQQPSEFAEISVFKRITI